MLFVDCPSVNFEIQIQIIFFDFALIYSKCRKYLSFFRTHKIIWLTFYWVPRSRADQKVRRRTLTYAFFLMGSNWLNTVSGIVARRRRIFLRFLQDQHTLGRALKHYFCEGFRHFETPKPPKFPENPEISRFFLFQVFFIFPDLAPPGAANCISDFKKRPPLV